MGESVEISIKLLVSELLIRVRTVDVSLEIIGFNVTPHRDEG